MIIKKKKRHYSAFCLMFISRELHSGMARNDTISFNSFYSLFTVKERAMK